MIVMSVCLCTAHKTVHELRPKKDSDTVFKSISHILNSGFAFITISVSIKRQGRLRIPNTQYGFVTLLWFVEILVQEIKEFKQSCFWNQSKGLILNTQKHFSIYVMYLRVPKKTQCISCIHCIFNQWLLFFHSRAWWSHWMMRHGNTDDRQSVALVVNEHD